MEKTNKTRYSDSELQEFKELIQGKLKSSREEFLALTSSLSSPNSHGTEDTSGAYKTLEDGSATLGSGDTQITISASGEVKVPSAAIIT